MWNKCFNEYFDFVDSNPDKTVTGYAIIYAWNEFEEGGYICPTLGKNGKPDTAFLDSFTRVRNKYKK